MKKLLCIALMAVGLLVPTNAKDGDENKIPGVEFNKMEHDYGNLPYEGDGNTEFILTNTGEEPLIIKDCRASCGCTTPKWSKEPVLPGKTSVIEVGYNTRISGRFSKSIQIITNRGFAFLDIKGNVAPRKN